MAEEHLTLKRCAVCNEEKPTTEYAKRPRCRGGLRRECRTCQSARTRARRKSVPGVKERALAGAKRWRVRNPEKVKEGGMRWQREHPEKARAYRKRWREENRERVNLQAKERRKKNADHANFKMRARNKRIREAVIAYYSEGRNRCECCGEYRYEFLAIDHINGGGGKHLRSIGCRSLTHWLFQHKFPPGYRILCHNCNFARGLYGYCPHEKEIALRFQ